MKAQCRLRAAAGKGSCRRGGSFDTHPAQMPGCSAAPLPALLLAASGPCPWKDREQQSERGARKVPARSMGKTDLEELRGKVSCGAVLGGGFCARPQGKHAQGLTENR